MVTNAAIFYLARPNATSFGYAPGVRSAHYYSSRPLRLKTFKRECPRDHVKSTVGVRWPNHQVTEGVDGLSERAAKHVLLPLGRRRFRSRRLPRRDKVIPLLGKLLGYFLDPCDRCCRCSVGCSLGCKRCISPSDPFERFHRCPRFHDALLLTPKARRNGLRLLTGEHQSALYVTALQTLQRVVLEAGDRHGAGLHHLRHIHFCRAH
jgi:hypothetical protein